MSEDKSLVTIERQRRKIERLRERRDYWRNRAGELDRLIALVPSIARTMDDYHRAVAKSKRLKELEARTKEQEALIARLLRECGHAADR